MKQANRYDYFLFILIVSLAFGAIGGSLQMPRLFSILFAPLFFRNINLAKGQIKRHIDVVLCFLGYCLLSLIWSPDISEGLTELVYFFLHFLLFFEVIVFTMCAKKPIEIITKGWLLAVSLTVLFAFWEFQTGHHLPYCRNDAESMVNLGGGQILQKEFAAVAFINYNTYVTYLCFAIPFLFYIIANKNAGKPVFFWLSIVVVVLASACILRNGSRGGLLSILTVLGVYFLMRPKNKSWIIALTLLVLFVAYVIKEYGEVFSYMMMRASDGKLTEGGERLVVWSYALERFFDTLGFGVGIGGMAESMQGISGDIKITHNIFLEILLQYGLVFFVFFVVFLVKMFMKARRLKDFPRKVTVFTALISFPIYGIVNSGYLFNPFVYAGFASLYVFCNYDSFRPLHKNIR